MPYTDPSEAEAEAWYQRQIAESDAYAAYWTRKIENMPYLDSDDELDRIRREIRESRRLDDDLELEGQRFRFLVMTAGDPDPLPSHRPRPRRRSFVGARRNLKIMMEV